MRTLDGQVWSVEDPAVAAADAAAQIAAQAVTDSSTYALLGGIPALMVGAGIDYTGATDSTTAMQAFLDANPGVTILIENGILQFSNLTLSKGQWLKGSGWRDYRDLPGLFGNAGWMVASTFSGTVLRSTATTGNAITIVDTAVTEGSLSDFILIGPGTGTSVGIYIGSATMSVVHPVWRNIKVGNFATGVTTTNVNEGSFYDLTIHGCTTPLNLFTATRQNAFYGLDMQINGGPALVTATCYANTFYSMIGQSNTGTAISVSGNKTVFVNPYLENNGTYGIDFVSGDSNTVIAPHLNSVTDGIRVQAACTGTYLQGSQFAGYLTNSSTTSIIVDNYFSGAPFGPWSSYAPTLAGTGWAIGNGTIAAAYTTIGKTVHMQVIITFGSTSTFGSASPTITLPFSAVGGYGNPRAVILRQGVGYYQLAPMQSAATYVTIFSLGTAGAFVPMTATVPAAFAATDVLQVYSTYQRA